VKGRKIIGITGGEGKKSAEEEERQEGNNNGSVMVLECKTKEKKPEGKGEWHMRLLG
jgi:hypothetical protein